MTQENGNGNGTPTAPPTDDFFAPLGLDRPFIKLAAEGFAGSGKSFTLTKIAIGIHAKVQSTKPVVIFDTEESAGHLASSFAEANIPAVVRRSRSLADLKEAMSRCRAGYSDILIIDSITHVWEGFLAAFLQSKKKTRIDFADWSVIRPTWKREFSEPFVRDRYHILMTGRAGFEYGNEIDDDGKRQIFKSGIKMKVDNETAYEPDMLVLMERKENVLGAQNEERKAWREATILKDRSQLIDGKTFRDPTFKDFEPALDKMLRVAVDLHQPPERDATELFVPEENRKEFITKRDILLEKIEGEMVSAWPGASADAKRSKADALQESFGTRSWTEVSKMGLGALEEGLAKMTKIAGDSKQLATANAS